MNEVELTGLDGANPLGFMAALGVIEALGGDDGVRLAWRDRGVWRPVVSGLGGVDDLVARLDADRQACRDDAALQFAYADGTRDLKPPPAEWRALLERLVAGASPDERRSLDWAAAFATDVAVDNNGNTKPMPFHFTAGQQTFLKMAVEIQSEVTTDDLREALVGPWRYEREIAVMGWDATASRDYALRASNPAKDKKTGVPGADWLALRGLGALPSAPRGARLMTVGCGGEWKTGWFRWALWTELLGRSVVRTVTRLADVGAMSAAERRARGLGVVFESGIRRSDQGGYGSFTPAAAI